MGLLRRCHGGEDADVVGERCEAGELPSRRGRIVERDLVCNADADFALVVVEVRDHPLDSPVDRPTRLFTLAEAGEGDGCDRSAELCDFEVRAYLELPDVGLTKALLRAHADTE